MHTQHSKRRRCESADYRSDPQGAAPAWAPARAAPAAIGTATALPCTSGSSKPRLVTWGQPATIRIFDEVECELEERRALNKDNARARARARSFGRARVAGSPAAGSSQLGPSPRPAPLSVADRGLRLGESDKELCTILECAQTSAPKFRVRQPSPEELRAQAEVRVALHEKERSAHYVVVEYVWQPSVSHRTGNTKGGHDASCDPLPVCTATASIRTSGSMVAVSSHGNAVFSSKTFAT